MQQEIQGEADQLINFNGYSFVSCSEDPALASFIRENIARGSVLSAGVRVEGSNTFTQITSFGSVQQRIGFFVPHTLNLDFVRENVIIRLEPRKAKRVV